MWPRLLLLYGAALVAFCLSQETSLRAVRQEEQQSFPRPRRQIALFQLPRLLFTLFRVIRETRNDTRSAIQQISKILSDNIVDAPSTMQPPPQSTPAGEGEDNMTTTTEFVLTRDELLRIARLNIRGLVRLFNQEVDIAVNSLYRFAVQRERQLCVARAEPLCKTLEAQVQPATMKYGSSISMLVLLALLLPAIHSMPLEDAHGDHRLERTKRQATNNRAQVIDNIFQIPIQTLTAVNNLVRNTRPLIQRRRFSRRPADNPPYPQQFPSDATRGARVAQLYPAADGSSFKI